MCKPIIILKRPQQKCWGFLFPVKPFLRRLCRKLFGKRITDTMVANQISDDAGQTSGKYG